MKWLITTDLKEGTGELWAGQTKLKDSVIAALKTPSDSELEPNLGAEVPIDSRILNL